VVGNDALLGLAGNDTMIGGVGNDNLIGGIGNDTYYIDGSSDQVIEMPVEGTDTVHVQAGSYSSGVYRLVANVENLTMDTASVVGQGNALNNVITGSAGNDQLGGNDGNDTVSGMLGNDLLYGGNGNDVLIGGPGRDLLVGGADADVFVFNDPAEGGDAVFDFVSGIDSLQFNAAAFGFASAQSLDATNFVAGEAPHATESRPTFLLDTNSDNLYWDADGTGATAPELIASLNARAALSDLHLA
jgi:Ca2+-binding RTX toxin-like protein